MQSQGLQKAIEALKVIAQAMSPGGETCEEVQNAVSEVSIYLSNANLDDKINDFAKVDEILSEDHFDQVVNAVEHSATAISDAPVRVQVHLELGDIMYSIGRWDDALNRFEKGLELSEEESDLVGQAYALRQIGRLKRRRGHWKAAKLVLDRAAKIFKQLGDSAGEAEVWLNLGNIEFEQGNYEQAEKTFKQALRIARALKSDKMAGDINLSLGTVHQVRGEVYKAIEHYEACLDAYTTAGDQRRMGQAAFNLGVSQRDSGRWSLSGMSYEQGLELARETKDLGLIGMIYLRRAETQMLLWDTTMAMIYCRRAMRIFTRLGDPLGKADTYRLYGRAANTRGVWKQAMDYLAESVRLHQEYSCPLGEAEATEEWGWLYEAMGERDQAIESFQKARAMFETLGAENDIQRVKDTLQQLGGVAA